MHLGHKVIVIPGLGDNLKLTAWATKSWLNYGLEPVVYSMEWNNKLQQFQVKLNGLITLIDQYTANGNKVSMVGCSAGASAALNAFFERQGSVNKVVSICGRLRTGSYTGFRSLRLRAKSSPSFAQSVKFLEGHIDSLSSEAKKRIMTISAKFGDELVPTDTSMLDGAYNITVPVIEHSIGIYTSLTIFSGNMISFLNQ